MPHDAFDILGLPPRFDIDPALLHQAFLARVAAQHPDHADPRSSDDQSAAELNQAKRVLSNAEQRANLLLARFGGPPKEADRSLPDGFLATMMDIRQQIESAQQAGDSGELTRLIGWAESQQRTHRDSVSRAFAGLANPPTADQLRSIRRELNAWRYIERLIEQVTAAQEDGD